MSHSGFWLAKHDNKIVDAAGNVILVAGTVTQSALVFTFARDMDPLAALAGPLATSALLKKGFFVAADGITSVMRAVRKPVPTQKPSPSRDLV